MDQSEKRKSDRKKPRGSFRVKLFFSVVGCLVLMLACCWTLNTTMLENYYFSEKKEDLSTVFAEIDRAFQDNDTLSVRAVEVDRINVRINANIILSDIVTITHQFKAKDM